MWGKVTYQQFLDMFKTKEEFSLVELQKALNFNISDVKLKKFGGIAKEQGLVEMEKKICKGTKASRQIIFRKVG